MTRILALLLMLTPCAARADQIDYFCLFSNAAAAQADSVVGTYWNGTDWNRSVVFPGIQITAPVASLNGVSINTGFVIMVSSAGDNPALDAEVQTTGPCYVALDRDAAVHSQAFVFKNALPDISRKAIVFGPVPAGSAYPSPLAQ